MLDAVHLVIEQADPPEVWVQRVAHVVVEGGTVVVERPAAPFLQAFRLFQGAPTVPDTAERIAEILRARGFSSRAVDFSSGVARGHVVWVSRQRSAVVVAALLHRAESVLWADASGRHDAVAVWTPDDARRLSRTAAVVGTRASWSTVHVLTPPTAVDDLNEARAVLDRTDDWNLQLVDTTGTRRMTGLREALDATGAPLLVVGLGTDGLITPLLGVLGSLPVDLWVRTDPRVVADAGSLEASDAVAVPPGPAAVVRRCLGPLVWPPSDHTLHRVFRGTVEEQVQLRAGQLRWDARAEGVHGFCTDPSDPAGTLIATVNVQARDGKPIVLVGWPGPLPSRDDTNEYRVWACLFEPQNPETLRDEGFFDAVLEPDTVLDRGTPTDLPEASRTATLRRVGLRLTMAGYPVHGHLDLRSGALEPCPARPMTSQDLGQRLEARCGALPTRVEKVRWLLDGDEARRQLLDLLDQAMSSIDFQVYIFEVDDVGRQVADALERAARRGVVVRVLVDAVWSGQGAFDRENPLLARLNTTVGATVRASRPVEGVVDLKARDHRKLVVVDQQEALLPGRNVGNHYYTGFDSVALTPESDQRTVPWFDLSTSVTGPVVSLACQTFEHAWQDAAGSASTHGFEPVLPPQTANGVPGWWINHQALQDAHGLDTFRELLDEARESVVLVNTFVVQHELQHALLRRLDAGVAVRIYTGHVRPRFAAGAQPFPGSPERDLATGVIHGRFESIVQAGARAFALAVESDRWPAAVGKVLPHVHSKLVVVDHRYVVAGSHNLDIASAYWESELLLVLDAPDEAAILERWLANHEATALPFHTADGSWPAWRTTTRQPEWLSQHWPSLLS